MNFRSLLSPSQQRQNEAIVCKTIDQLIWMINVVRLPLTYYDRLEATGWSVVACVVIFGIAKGYHVMAARRDKKKWIHGQPICWWMAALYLVCATFAICTANDKRYFYDVVGTTGALGMFMGWYIGLIHGGMRLDRVFPLTRSSIMSQYLPSEEKSEEGENQRV